MSIIRTGAVTACSASRIIVDGVMFEGLGSGSFEGFRLRETFTR